MKRSKDNYKAFCLKRGRGKTVPKVIIPALNISNLNLHYTAREAIGSGDLLIYPVSRVQEACELLFEIPLGLEQKKRKKKSDTLFVKNSVLDIIDQRLEDLEELEEATDNKGIKKNSK